MSGDDRRVRLTVADDGPGFPEGLVDRAFERFVRATPVGGGDQGGAGLGLAIVAAIVRAGAGEARAGNGPPLGGAAVEVLLPRPR